MRSQIRAILLLGVLSALLVAVGGSLGAGALGLSIGLAAALNLGAYYFSDRIVLRMHRAEEVDAVAAPGVHRIVEELAARAGIPKPRVFVIPEAQPNAFATGRSPSRGVVAVTSGLLGVLGEREVRGVIAHEIAHVKNRDVLVASIAATLAAAVGYIAHVLSFAFLFGRSGEEDNGSSAPAFLAAWVAPLAATLIQAGVSRSREYSADAEGAALTGDPEGLARALQKLERTARLVPSDATPATASLFIVSPLAGGERLLRLFSTHPPTADRVRRLRDMTGAPVSRPAA